MYIKQNITTHMHVHMNALLTLQQLSTYGIMHGYVNACSLYQTNKQETKP